MSLLDAIDGTFMNFAYEWAFSKPVRKVYYNLTITGLSVAVAMIIGTIELLGLAAAKLSLKGAFWGWVSALNINTLGYFIVGLFVATWALALLAWRVGRFEERWLGQPCAATPFTPESIRSQELPRWTDLRGRTPRSTARRRSRPARSRKC
jgi:nickel/cobalt transporter (NiCoT) family protein